MGKFKLEKPGLRIIKTVIAVFIVILIGYMSEGLLDPYEMAVVAVLAIQGTVIKSRKEIQNKIYATVFGTILGIVFMCLNIVIEYNYLNVFLAPLGVFIIAYVCSKLINRSSLIVIACYVFLLIVLEPTEKLDLMYPVIVLLNTTVASIIAIVINSYNPKRKNKKKIKVIDSDIVD